MSVVPSKDYGRRYVPQVEADYVPQDCRERLCVRGLCSPEKRARCPYHRGRCRRCIGSEAGVRRMA
jgi:hypothetical protein